MTKWYLSIENMEVSDHESNNSEQDNELDNSDN